MSELSLLPTSVGWWTVMIAAALVVNIAANVVCERLDEKRRFSPSFRQAVEIVIVAHGVLILACGGAVLLLASSMTGLLILFVVPATVLIGYLTIITGRQSVGAGLSTLATFAVIAACVALRQWPPASATLMALVYLVAALLSTGLTIISFVIATVSANLRG